MNVLVTGATGFIGTHVVNELIYRGHTTIALTRNKNLLPNKFVKYVYGDLCNIDCELIDQFASYRIDSCVHLAWQGIPDFSYENCINNLKFGLNLLDLFKKLDIMNLICSGSCWEYDKPIGMINENWSLSSRNSFSSVKNSFRMIAESFCRDNNINFYWLRLFYVYGVGQRSGALIPYIVDELKRGKYPQLKTPFDENDYINVEDVAKAIVDTMEIGPDESILNIGSGYALPVIDILKIIAAKLNINLDLSIYLKDFSSSRFWADISKSKKAICFEPKIKINDGLDQVIFNE